MGKKQMNFRLSQNAQEQLQLALDNELGDDMTEIIEYAILTYLWEEKPEVMRAYVEEKKKKIEEGYKRK